MKFAREFKEALIREGYPPHWVDSAIPYGQLKKCLKKVRRELDELGLDPDTIRQLLAAHATSHGDSVPLASYDLGSGVSSPLRPRLTVFVHLEDGAAVDATLTPASRVFLEKLATGQLPAHPSSSPPESPRSDSPASPGSPDDPDGPQPTPAVVVVDRVEVPLTFDGQFFDLLQSDVTSLDALQDAEETRMARDIARLGDDMAQLTRPHKFHKTDLSRWRHVFDLYLDAQVFFSTHERDHGQRSSAKALEQLVWFQGEVQKRGLVEQFKLAASREAYARFLELNAKMLQNLKFHEINRIAVTKILKKFDKRTSLGVSGAFTGAVHSRRFLSGGVAKDLCAQVSSHVVSTVPRVEDYSCPVCLSIAWLPVRLACSHVFCVRCIVKMQRERERACPMCRRTDAVLQADLRNLDHELARFMGMYFKKETREKQAASDLERGIEMFGEGYKPSSCVVM